MSPRERHMLRFPDKLAASQTPCDRQQDFAPTPNRFSVLAELEQSPTEVKWAFDHVPSSSRLSRRRSKRTDKRKLKHTSQNNRDVRNSEGVSELCDKVAALCLNNRPKRNETWNNVNTPTDTLPHHWAPQFRPDELAEPLGPGNVSFGPDRYIARTEASRSLDDHEEIRQRESRFFPLSAFLASPSPATHQTPASKPMSPVLTQFSQAKRSFGGTPYMSAQEAVASACQALAMQKPSAVAPEDPLVAFVHRPSLPSSVAVPSVSADRQTPEPSYAMALPASSLPITSPHIASPVLTPTAMSIPPSTASPCRPMDFKPRYLSEELPQPLSTDSTVSPNVSQVPSPYHYSYGEMCPSSLITAPVTSPRPFIAPPHPHKTMVPPPFGVTRLDEALRCALLIHRSPERSHHAARSSVSIEDFLKLGHANPCWCSNCPNSVPLGELPHEKATATLDRESNGTTLNTSDLGPSTRRQLEEVLVNDPREEQEMQEIAASEEMKTPELVPTPRSYSGSEPGSEFEDLTRSVREAFSSGSDDSGSQEDAWTIVSPDDDRHIKSQVSTPPSRETMSGTKTESAPEVMILPTSSPALSDTAWMIPTFDFELRSPRQELAEAMSLWRSPSPSPVLTPVLPSTPPPSSVHSPKQTRRSTPAARSDGTFNAQAIQGQHDVADQSRANASAVEWPTLHEALHMNKRRTNVGPVAEDKECKDEGSVANWLA